MNLNFELCQGPQELLPLRLVRKPSKLTPPGWEGLEAEGMSWHYPPVLNHRCRDGLQVLEVLLGLTGAQLLDVSRDPPVRLKEDGSTESTRGQLENRLPVSITSNLPPGTRCHTGSSHAEPRRCLRSGNVRLCNGGQKHQLQVQSSERCNCTWCWCTWRGPPPWRKGRWRSRRLSSAQTVHLRQDKKTVWEQ